MRHIFVVIDMSSAMLEQDLKPNRQFAITKVVIRIIDILYTTHCFEFTQRCVI